MGFLDIRIEKTERAIKQAFMELRREKPVEKIRVKELCDRACINKSTFYAHYQDIYAMPARCSFKKPMARFASVSLSTTMFCTAAPRAVSIAAEYLSLTVMS